MKQLIFCCIAIAAVSCKVNTHFKQGVSSGGYINEQQVSCLPGNPPFIQHVDYTIFQCLSDSKVFYYLPARLITETDINGNPILFSQYLGKREMNVLVNFSYKKEDFVSAAQHLQSLDAGYTLQLLPINSIAITPMTILPDAGFDMQSVPKNSFFEGYSIIQVKGRKQISFLRGLLLNNVGLQQTYQFRIPFAMPDGSISMQVSQLIISFSQINL
jgi:hypothetical protein